MRGTTQRGLGLVVALALLAAVDAEAQVKRVIEMSEDELAQMGAAAAKLYTDPGAAPGTSEAWQAASGTAGTVQLVETYEFEGMPCARLHHKVRRATAADPQTFTIDRCQTPDGEWKIR